MGTIIEDLYEHEGYGARRLRDGSLTGISLRETAASDAYIAACGCGWQGEHAHPPTEEGYESAVDEWERSHARPLLAETVPAGVDTAIRDAKQAIGRLARERPAAALRVRDELGGWIAVSRHRLDHPDSNERKVTRMRARLDALEQPGSTRSLGV